MYNNVNVMYNVMYNRHDNDIETTWNGSLAKMFVSRSTSRNRQFRAWAELLFVFYYILAVY